MIPCTSKCVYQSDGLCTLDSAASAGLPALGGACIHFIPQGGERLGSPHRYSGPGSPSSRSEPLWYLPDEPAPRTSGIPGDGPQTPAEPAD